MKSKIINMNNKSRKGQYLYVKQPGAPARYYKITNLNQKPILEKYYNEKYIDKINTIKPKFSKETLTKPKKKTVKKKVVTKPKKKITPIKIKQSEKINKLISKGMSTQTVINLMQAGPTKLNKYRKDILDPLVNDKNQLKSLIKHENQKKLAFRYSHQITIINTKGEKIIEMSIYGKTPEQIKNDLRNIGLTNGVTTDKGSRYESMKILKEAGYQINTDNGAGEVASINLKTTFRKNI